MAVNSNFGAKCAPASTEVNSMPPLPYCEEAPTTMANQSENMASLSNHNCKEDSNDVVDKKVAAEKRELVDSAPESNETKKQKLEEDSKHAITETSSDSDPSQVIDTAEKCGLKAGDRIEVQWQVGGDSDAEKETRWWGATLLAFDGRTEESVAIRTLDYDPYPEGGFPERSREDVIFLGRDALAKFTAEEDAVCLEPLRFRREGDVEEEGTVWVDSEERLEQIVNETLMGALQKNAQAWGGLSSAQQALIADKIAQKKQRLIDLLSQRCQSHGVITPSDMQEILRETVEED